MGNIDGSLATTKNNVIFLARSEDPYAFLELSLPKNAYQVQNATQYFTPKIAAN